MFDASEQEKTGVVVCAWGLCDSVWWRSHGRHQARRPMVQAWWRLETGSLHISCRRPRYPGDRSLVCQTVSSTATPTLPQRCSSPCTIAAICRRLFAPTVMIQASSFAVFKLPISLDSMAWDTQRWDRKASSRSHQPIVGLVWCQRYLRFVIETGCVGLCRSKKRISRNASV
jgi:hypothetical protein